jgi:hypothetical protein
MENTKCDKKDICVDNESREIDLVVTKTNHGTEIVQITPISSVLITEITDNIDHDNISLIEAIGLFKNKSSSS